MRADRQIKIRQFLFSRNNVTYRNAKTAKLKSTIFAQSAKYNSRQYFRLYGMCCVILSSVDILRQAHSKLSCVVNCSHPLTNVLPPCKATHAHVSCVQFTSGLTRNSRTSDAYREHVARGGKPRVYKM